MFWNKRQAFLLEYSGKIILIALAIGIGIRLFLLSSYSIKTSAMQPALMAGEFVLGRKAFTPERGDIVILPCPESELNSCVKRIVGLGGDRIETIDGQLKINAKEPSVWNPSISPDMPEEMAPTVVPPEHVFLLNDERRDRHDSRKWGAIPVSRLDAKATMIWMSVDWSKNRLNWGRLLQRID